MSEYSFRNTAARKLAREMMELKARRPPMISRLTRANTGIRNIYLKSKETGSSRGEIEEANVLEQCQQVILPPVPGKSLCWLCGFPIEGIRLPEAPGNLYWSEYLDSAVCEHVLPVRLAGVITGLYNPYGGVSRVGNEHLLHSVYEYSHHLCNLAKSDTWFLSKPNKLIASYCDLIVNTEKINSFLDYLFTYTVGPLGRHPVTFVEQDGILKDLLVDRHESGIFTIKENKAKRLFENNVQLYIFEKYRRSKSDFDLLRMKEEWKAEQFLLMEEKTKRLIQKIKNADGCGTPEEGKLYSATMSALTTLELKGRIERNVGPSPAFFARSPSINNIARSFRSKKRPHNQNEENTSRSKLLKLVTPGNILGILGFRPTLQNQMKLHQLQKRSRKKGFPHTLENKLKKLQSRRKKGSKFGSKKKSKLKKKFLK
jgi:hypothetical protein